MPFRLTFRITFRTIFRIKFIIIFRDLNTFTSFLRKGKFCIGEIVINKTKAKVYREETFIKTLKGEKIFSNMLFLFLCISCIFSVIAC